MLRRAGHQKIRINHSSGMLVPPGHKTAQIMAIAGYRLNLFRFLALLFVRLSAD